MKNDKTILWIIGIAILLFIILPKLQVPAEEGMIGLTPHYYKDGVEVFPKFSLLGFSIVTPPGGTYDQISLSISGTSQEVPYSNIQIINASPTTFKNALPTTTQSLAIGQSKILWTSGLMDTAQFESLSQPVRFWVNVSAVNDYTETTEYAEGFVDLEIKQEIIESISIMGDLAAYPDSGFVQYDEGDWYTGSWGHVGVIEFFGKNRNWVIFNVSNVPNSATISNAKLEIHISDAQTGRGGDANCPSYTVRTYLYNVNEEYSNYRQVDGSYPANQGARQTLFNSLDDGNNYGEISVVFSSSNSKASYGDPSNIGDGWRNIAVSNAEIQSLVDGNPTKYFMIGLKGGYESLSANCAMWIDVIKLSFTYRA